MKNFSLVIAAIFLSLTLCSVASANQIDQTFGAGLGLPYGGIGVNYEIGLTDYFAPTVGVGHVPDNLGWNVGARIYFPGREAKLRGRLTALYGTNTILEKKSYWTSQTEYETREGFSGGIGLKYRFSDNWTFDSDIYLVNEDVPQGYTEEGSSVKFSLGFGWRW